MAEWAGAGHGVQRDVRNKQLYSFSSSVPFIKLRIFHRVAYLSSRTQVLDTECNEQVSFVDLCRELRKLVSGARGGRRGSRRSRQSGVTRDGADKGAVRRLASGRAGSGAVHDGPGSCAATANVRTQEAAEFKPSYESARPKLWVSGRAPRASGAASALTFPPPAPLSSSHLTSPAPEPPVLPSPPVTRARHSAPFPHPPPRTGAPRGASRAGPAAADPPRA